MVEVVASRLREVWLLKSPTSRSAKASLPKLSADVCKPTGEVATDQDQHEIKMRNLHAFVAPMVVMRHEEKRTGMAEMPTEVPIEVSTESPINPKSLFHSK
jgi:hypothetical protein